MLLVNRDHPDRALTIYDYDNKDSPDLPCGLGFVSIKNLKMQVFHAYYEEFNNTFWLSLDFDPQVRTLAAKTSLQATRSNIPQKSGLHLKRIGNSDYFRITLNDTCLTVEKSKSIRDDYYPLRFRQCVDDISQEFAFISALKAKCHLKLAECPVDKDVLLNAEVIIEKRLKQFEIV
ncbi:hypothetical protein DMUE_3421 [Dictyocoela muelleri]|nr:hypothetical protein DMUE_3421 [Dictyocoela muelleri]